MRNIWYPQKRAQYVTDAQLRTMKDVTVERDPLFGMEQIAKEQDTKVEPQLKLLSVRFITYQSELNPVLIISIAAKSVANNSIAHPGVSRLLSIAHLYPRT